MKDFKFTDNEGDEWSVKVHAATLADIETGLDVKFAQMGEDDGPLMRMLNDYLFCFRCLFIVCKKQCGARGLDSEAFSERLIGDAFSLAQDALINAVIEFFPSAERRDAAKDLVKQMRNAEVLLTRKAREQLNALNMDEITDQIVGVNQE